MIHHETRATSYRVELKGPIPTSLTEELDSFVLEAGSTSTLTGPISDAAQLYGLIARLESLGLTLLSVRATTPTPLNSLCEHSRLLLASHKAMRADSDRLVTAVSDLADREPAAAAALGRSFDTIVTLIHDHHNAEDDVMYPFLIDRIPGFEHDAAQLERDHVLLDAAMTRVGAGLRLLAHPASRAAQQTTQQHLNDDALAFKDLLLDHLRREEAAVIPPFESTLSAAEHRALSRAESKLTTYRHVRTAVPWVLANATTDEAAVLRRLAPRLIGALHDHLWKRRFHRLMAPLYATPANT